MRSWLSVVLLVLATFGCKKSSKEYFEAQRLHDSLVAQDGEDAYLVPEMQGVAQTLAAVPSNAVEYKRAQELLAKVNAETARMQAAMAQLERERLEAQRLQEAIGLPAMPESRPVVFEPQQPEARPAPVDAGVGPEYPTAGMTMAEFQRFFGACVKAQTTFDRGDGKPVPAFPALDSEACTKRLRVPAGSLMYFMDGKLVGSATLIPARSPVAVDAGPAVARPAFLLVPGGPRPPGYDGVPGTGVMPNGAPPPPSDTPPSTLQPRAN